MKAPTPFSLRIYSGTSRLFSPAVHLLLNRRRKKGKEDPVRHPERRGYASVTRPSGPLIWLHGASVGELISLLPIIEHFCNKGHGVLVTSGTVTSAGIAARRLPRGAIHQYIPVDLPGYVKRFLDHWKPDIGVFAESELWPNLVRAAHKGGSHLVIVNARMSARSFGRWQRLPGFIKALLSRFELVLAQSNEDAERLQALGAPRVQTVGNLKYDVAPPPVDKEKFMQLRDAIKGRPVLIAASTHPGEEAILADAHRIIRSQVPNILTIIAPRHPERGQEIGDMLSRSGITMCRRSDEMLPDIHTDIYVADTMGELGLVYSLGQLSFLGGSLVAHGGQNPIEPAKLGNAVLHGPHIHNFKDVYEILSASGGAFQVTDAENLAKTVTRLFRDMSLLARMASAAGKSVQGMSGASQRAIDAIEPLLLQAHLERNG